MGERGYGTRKKKGMKEQGRRGVDGRRKEYILGKRTTPEWLRYNGDAQTTFPLIALTLMSQALSSIALT